VVAVGRNDYGQCDVSNWTDIIQVSAGLQHTVGLKADGTVVAIGDNNEGQCSVGNWTDITQIAAGMQHTVGLKKDGGVVAAGDNEFGQLGVGSLTSIHQIAAGSIHTIALLDTGTVVARGQSLYGQCNVGDWTDIVQVATGARHTLGLMNDKTVVSTGDGYYGQRKVSDWTDIKQISAGGWHTVGLKADGTVVAAGPEVELAKWNLGVVEYSLTTVSAPNGSIISPDEGTSTYNAGRIVSLMAKPDMGYRLVSWTGDVHTIANVNGATTFLAMHDDYTITADFALNWPLIGGIIAGVVAAAGLATFLVRRNRCARTGKRAQRQAARKKH